MIEAKVTQLTPFPDDEDIVDLAAFEFGRHDEGTDAEGDMYDRSLVITLHIFNKHKEDSPPQTKAVTFRIEGVDAAAAFAAGLYHLGGETFDHAVWASTWGRYMVEVGYKLQQ